MDASTAAASVLADGPHHESARLLIAGLSARHIRFIAPPLFESEADSVIRRRVHIGTLASETGTAAQALMDAFPVEIIQDPGGRLLARQLAERHNLVRVYDATYAALAQRRQCDLWTADERFYNSVRNALPFVRFVGGYNG